MGQSSFNDLKQKLAILRERQTGSQKTLPALSLLRIATPFLLKLAKQNGSSLRTQTIHFLMEEWYDKQDKFDTKILAEYPPGRFDSFCFHCLCKLDSCTNSMPSTCFWCKAHPSLHLYFFQDLLEFRYKIHPIWIEKLFCEYLLKRDYGHFTDSTNARDS